MSDLESNLDNYYLQLQQVEAALTSDPTNEELIKLKNDLQEVIDLTKELCESSMESDLDGPSTSYDEGSKKDWKVGDKCLARWSQDGKYYEAVIEEIHADGKVSVGYPAYSHGDVMNISTIKPYDPSYVPPTRTKTKEAIATNLAGKRPNQKESLAERKIAILKQKEYLKKRKQKKIARVQEQESAREKEKKKWLNFSTKKGLLNKKKSIFASPETVDGRVGIGTCGVSGKPMTEYSVGEKWRKGWTS